jgi:hypothetical protein
MARAHAENKTMNARRTILAGVATLAGYGLGQLTSGRHLVSRGGNEDSSTRTAPDARQKITSEDPLAAALESLAGPGDLASFARFGAAMERLSSEQMQTLLERVERSSDRNVKDGLAWLFTLWLKRDPSAAAEWIRPRLNAAAQDGPPGYSFDSSTRGSVILAWARADLKAALAFATEHARSGLAVRLLNEVLAEWPEKDPALRLATILNFPAGMARNDALKNHLANWARKEPKAAFAMAEGIADKVERDRAVKSVLNEWAGRDPAAAFENYRALGLSDRQLLGRLMSSGGEKDPQKAVEWLGSLSTGEFMRNAPIVVEAWAKKDPASALSWALENGVPMSGRSEVSRSIHHNGLGRSITTSFPGISPLAAAFEKPEETMAWIRSLPPGPDRERMLVWSVGYMKTPEQGIAVFNELPPEAATRAVHSVVSRFKEDSDGARAWVESLPQGPARIAAWHSLGSMTSTPIDLHPGPERDAMLSGRAFGMGVGAGPIPRLELISQIDDSVVKRDLFDQAIELNAQINPSDWLQQSLDWMEKSDLPEDWKRSWRATYGK